jgi:hypothetical protein
VRPGNYYALAIRGSLRIADLSSLAPYAASVHVERAETANIALNWARLP